MNSTCQKIQFYDDINNIFRLVMKRDEFSLQYSQPYTRKFIFLNCTKIAFLRIEQDCQRNEEIN